MRRKAKWKFLKLLWNTLYKMICISRKTYERNGIETIIDNGGILWLNETHAEEGIDHENLREITTKYNSNHRKNRYELVEERKKQVNRIFINQKK